MSFERQLGDQSRQKDVGTTGKEKSPIHQDKTPRENVFGVVKTQI